MDENILKKILIIGSSAVEYTLAKKLIESDNISEVYVAPGNSAMSEFCNVVDIRENSIQELLEFVLENAIDLTIASSEAAIKSDIATIFHKHNQMVFAPTQASAAICISKSAGKKFMYKNKILCPKFGIFDKPQLAIDYVKKSSIPIVVKTNEHQKKGVLVCNSQQIAKDFIEELFETGEAKVVLEDYILGHEFSFYIITDGYHALPLGSVATYKYELEGNGGLTTARMGAYTPDYRISKQTEQKIMGNIIYPTLNHLAKQQTPYVGILGVDLIITDDDKLYAIEFNSFLQPPDGQGIIALLNENLYSLFEACTVGSFADDYEQLDISDSYAISCVIASRKKDQIIQGLDDLDDSTQIAHFHTRKNAYLEVETSVGRNIILTRTARVLSKAVDDLYDEVEMIKFDGIKYRKDIGGRSVRLTE